MPIFHAIAAMSENRIIGGEGKIPWYLPEDFRWFKHKTMGGTLVMGRKTYESIGKPLPGRKTLVLSRTMGPIPGVEICREIRNLPSDHSYSFDGSDIHWVCGGGEIYMALLPQCFFLYLTRVKRRVTGETPFPAFEDLFGYDQVIHENHEFRVERWKNRSLQWRDYPQEPEVWPFSPAK